MQSSPTNSFYEASQDRQLTHTADHGLHSISTHCPASEGTSSVAPIGSTEFRSHFVDFMEMGADVQTVEKYLDGHSEWFHRCAHPMVVESIGANSYAMTVGRFGAFGFDVEPKIGLDLLPHQESVYRIETVPVPNYTEIGYEVDFRAAMELIDLGNDTSGWATTRIQWELDLAVAIQFPKFIHALPETLIRRTGDRILNQVVRQVSRRLTHKVQEDFHSSHCLPLPKRAKKQR
ncbi:MAG: DUF1997 domain-containing protein [Myxacorys chilensis ATA2-1-KO14]|jgi:hypothetical protein|nr:DUF1997 domain-containing protein [Myxacorys chilensis ATA2-1-KO14]